MDIESEECPDKSEICARVHELKKVIISEVLSYDPVSFCVFANGRTQINKDTGQVEINPSNFGDYYDVVMSFNVFRQPKEGETDFITLTYSGTIDVLRMAFYNHTSAIFKIKAIIAMGYEQTVLAFNSDNSEGEGKWQRMHETSTECERLLEIAIQARADKTTDEGKEGKAFEAKYH